MSNFRPIHRDTGFLLPPSVDEWLPERHLARFVVEVIEGLDLSAMSQSYRGTGSASYHPKLLLGILVYGYATGVVSSRKLERATYDSVAFRFIAANDHPDHDTIAAFRRRFLPRIEGLFVQVLLLAREMGLLQLGTVALDGTKVQANASRHSALSYEHAGKIEAQLKAEVAELAAREAKAAITGRKPGGRAPEPPIETPRPADQINLTDEESRIMPVAGGGFEQCHNAQAVVTAGSLLVLATDVVQAANDKQQLTPMLGKLAGLPEALGRPDTLLADSGYFSAANVTGCQAAGLGQLIALGREEHYPTLAERFAAPPPPPDHPTPVEAMAHRLRTPEGRALYALRKHTPEPVFGIIKAVLGFRQFLLRGLDAVRGEWRLVTLAWNLKRMFALTRAAQGRTKAVPSGRGCGAPHGSRRGPPRERAAERQPCDFRRHAAWATSLSRAGGASPTGC